MTLNGATDKIGPDRTVGGRPRIVRALLLGLLVAAAPQLALEADACSCVGPLPACEAADRADVVFEGLVTSIVAIDEGLFEVGGRSYRRGELRVTFEVLKGWRGGPGASVDIVTDGAGSSCHFGFAERRRYLVYALRHEGVLRSGMCTRTAPIERAADDLAYLRASASAPATGARVFGRAVARPNDPLRGSGEPIPVPGVRIVATGPVTRETTTAEDGRYALEGLRPGEFQITATTSDYRTAEVDGQPVAVGPGGCAQRDISVFWDGRIAGAVYRADGRPLVRVPVDVAPVNLFPAHKRLQLQTGYSDAAGRFELRGLEPGSYVVGVNLARTPTDLFAWKRTFLPGVHALASATIVEVGKSQHVVAGTFTVEAVSKRLVTGTITLRDGSPAANGSIEYVEYREEYRDLDRRRVNADRDGHFRVELYDGLSYQLTALAPVPPPRPALPPNEDAVGRVMRGPPDYARSAAVRIEVGPDLAPLTFVVDR